MDAVIATSGLSKRYGKAVALHELDLEVPPGVVFGYLGPNGAGKTTTTRLLAGLLRPTSGSARVLGLDVAASPDEVQSRIGYLPGEFVAYPDLTAAQYLRFLANLRGGVDWDYVELLAKRLALDLERRIGALSHGNRQKVGLTQAFMHHPVVLLLDEPTSGLDPLMQQEFRAMVREARAAGQTVFLSSHILDEVEAVADVVGILRQGRLVVVESIEGLKSRALRTLELAFEETPPVAELEAVAGVTDLRVQGRRVFVTVAGSTAALVRAAAPHGVADLRTHEADLEQVFLTYYREG